VGRRSRAREKLPVPERGSAPSSDYSDEHGNVLTLRGSLTVSARREYAETLSGAGGRASTTREDTWQRAVELLFERLAVRWTIAPHGGAQGRTQEGAGRQAGAPIKRQRELLARLRAASPDERAWVREALREHCVKHFPDVHAP
jgi:hypothetical protein